MSYFISLPNASAYGYEALDLTDDGVKTPTASNFRNSNNLQVKYMMVTNTSSNVANYTLDGTTPVNTAGTEAGHPLIGNATMVVQGVENIRNFKVLNRVAGSDAVIRLTYFA